MPSFPAESPQPKMPPLEEGIETPATLQAIDARNKLDHDFKDMLGTNYALAANEPGHGYERIPAGQERFLDSLQATIDSFQPGLEAMRAKDFGEAQPIIDEIIEALSAPVPDYGTEVKSRYLVSQEVRPNNSKDPLQETVMIYSIVPTELDQDAKFLRGLSDRMPDHREDLLKLQEMLQTYAKNDIPKMESYLIRHRGPDTTTRGVNKMLQITGFLALSSLAFLTGITSIARAISKRKIEAGDFTAPMLYAGIAGLVASPSLRRSLWGDKRDVMLAEIDKKLNDKTFKETSAEYEIKGPAWRAGVQEIHDNETLRAFRPENESIEAKDMFAERVFPIHQSPQEHTAFRRLLDEPEKYRSVLAVAETQDPQALAVNLDYIEMDCNRYYRSDRHTLQAVREQTELA